MAEEEYEALLTPGMWRGKCGEPEFIEDDQQTQIKTQRLVELMNRSKRCVFITGAGISTSAGIRDFRGPNGVWTKKMQVSGPSTEHPPLTLSSVPQPERFNQACGTLTHAAMVALEKNGFIQLLISQNVDGLHMYTGFPRSSLLEPHGNVFLEFCPKCGQEYVRSDAVKSVGFKETARICEKCFVSLRDCTLDWKDPLCALQLHYMQSFMRRADLCVCLGTSLQVRPICNLPLILLHKTKRAGNLPPGNVVIVNLQKTPLDKKASLKISSTTDRVMALLLDYLGIDRPSVQSLSNSELQRSFSVCRDLLAFEQQMRDRDDVNSSGEEKDDETDDDFSG